MMDEAEVKVKKFWGLISPREHDEWIALNIKLLKCTMSTPENPESLAIKRKLDAMNLDFEQRCRRLTDGELCFFRYSDLCNWFDVNVSMEERMKYVHEQREGNKLKVCKVVNRSECDRWALNGKERQLKVEAFKKGEAWGYTDTFTFSTEEKK